MMRHMEGPATRAEFEECMQIVREQLVQGKLVFKKGLRGPESLLKVRLLPNRRIDLMSIDESARLQGNMARQFIDGAFDGVLPDTRGDELYDRSASDC